MQLRYSKQMIRYGDIRYEIKPHWFLGHIELGHTNQDFSQQSSKLNFGKNNDE